MADFLFHRAQLVDVVAGVDFSIFTFMKIIAKAAVSFLYSSHLNEFHSTFSDARSN